jgi:hypothetical protein
MAKRQPAVQSTTSPPDGIRRYILSVEDMLKWRQRHGSESPGEEAAAQVLEPDIGTQMRDEVKSVQARRHYDAPNYRAEHRQRFLTRADDIAIRNNLPPLIRYAQPPNEYMNYFESDPSPEIVPDVPLLFRWFI